MIDQQRLPPLSLEAESAVLGAILIDPDAIVEVADFLKADDFYRQSHRIIYQAMLDVYTSGRPTDIVLVSERIEADGNLDAAGGRSYIAGLSTGTPSAVHVVEYGKVVRRKATLRTLIAAAGKIAAIAYEDPEDIDAAVDRAENEVYGISDKRVVQSYTTLRPLLMAAYDTIDHLYQHKGEVTGIATGFRDLDHMTQGFQPNDLVIIAARPSVGKTSFALNVAEHTALMQDKRIGVFSLEMSKEQLVLRLLSSTSGVDSQRLRTGFLDSDDFQKLVHGMGALDKAGIFIDDTPSLTLNELRTKARRMKREVNVDLIIVDYLQLLHAPNAAGKDTNRVQEVSAISAGLKQIARELKVPVIALSQLNRGSEARDSGEPRLSDLRESGSIEQDADVVVFLWKKAAAQDGYEVNEDGEWVYAKVAKQRNGPTGDFQLWFRKAQTRFYSGDAE
jgi:replicative DNA helicase